MHILCAERLNESESQCPVDFHQSVIDLSREMKVRELCPLCGFNLVNAVYRALFWVRVLAFFAIITKFEASHPLNE